MIDFCLDAFATNYEVTASLGPRNPERTFLINYRRDGKSHLDVLTLRIQPRTGQEWEGEFGGGGDGFGGAYSTPDPDVLCVIAGDAGYLVDVLQPLKYRLVPAGPIDSVFQVASVPAIVLVGATDVTIYSGADEVWTSQQISYDGFKDLQVHGNELRGKAWLAPTDEWYDFKVDLVMKEVHGNRY